MLLHFLSFDMCNDFVFLFNVRGRPLRRKNLHTRVSLLRESYGNCVLPSRSFNFSDCSVVHLYIEVSSTRVFFRYAAKRAVHGPIVGNNAAVREPLYRPRIDIAPLCFKQSRQKLIAADSRNSKHFYPARLQSTSRRWRRW